MIRCMNILRCRYTDHAMDHDIVYILRCSTGGEVPHRTSLLQLLCGVRGLCAGLARYESLAPRDYVFRAVANSSSSPWVTWGAPLWVSDQFRYWPLYLQIWIRSWCGQFLQHTGWSCSIHKEGCSILDRVGYSWPPNDCRAFTPTAAKYEVRNTRTFCKFHVAGFVNSVRLFAAKFLEGLKRT